MDSRDEAERPAGAPTLSVPSLLDTVSDGIVVLDRDWRYVFVNRAGAAMFSREPADLIGRHIWTEFPEGVGQPFHLAYERAMATQESAVIEDYYAPWGRWFENRVYPSPDTLSIFYHDVTDRKLADIALRDTTQRLRATIEGTGTGLWDWDLRTDKVHFSTEWKRQIGFADREISDDFEEWRSRVHPDDLPGAMARVQAFLASPHPGFENEFRFRHKDGSYRWILARSTLVPGIDGAPARMIGIHLDITDRKYDQFLLESQNRILDLVARGTPVRVVLDELARAIERLTPGALASVLLLDDDGVHTRHAAAPSLPADFVRHVDGQPIGDRAGSCGTAMFRREAVVVEDIRADPLWTDYRALALEHGLLACWSTPIQDAERRVLGSFALYWREPRRPDHAHQRAVDMATHVAAIALTRARQETALRDSEAHARRLFEQANDAIHVVSADGRFLDVNRRAVEMLGYSREEFLARKVDDIVPPEERRRLAPSARETGTAEPLVSEWEHVRKDGVRLPVEVSSRRLDDGTFLAIVRDLSERKRAEQALRDSFNQIRQLGVRVERAREAERAHIARELHDELGQVLTGIKMDLSWITRRLPKATGELRERVGAMTKLLDDAVGLGRRIASELRPGVLDDLGLAAALRWLAREFQQRSGIVVNAEIDDDMPVDGERATAAFRIVQEALTNVTRHAAATRVDLRATVNEGTLALDICDNGRGISPTQAASGDTLGLLGMRERVATWSGSIEIAPAPDRGTRVSVRIPLGDRA